MTLTRSTGGLARGRSPAWIPGLVTLAGLLALPWARTDRSLLEFGTPLLVLNQAPTLGILLFTIT